MHGKVVGKNFIQYFRKKQEKALLPKIQPNYQMNPKNQIWRKKSSSGNTGPM
jgi:hypothetical protein